MRTLQRPPKKKLHTRLGDSIEFCRTKIKELRPPFVVITLFLVFSAPFVNSIGFKFIALFAFLTNLLFLIFDLKSALFAKAEEIKNSVDEIKITILNCNPLAFQSSINVIDFSVALPTLIGTSIEGCLSPTYRDSIDLTKLYKVRAYCDFLKTEEGKDYPPILVCTGRSQGYVELLAQALGLTDLGLTEGRVEIPFVIEMGTALYYPVSKITKSLVSEEDKLLIREIERILREEDQRLKNIIFEFEPKSFIVTVNPSGSNTETFDELIVRISSLLDEKKVGDMVRIISSHTAIDIVPKRIEKLDTLQQRVKEYTGGQQGLESIVYIVENNGDKPIIESVRAAYCSESEATYDIKKAVKDTFGSDHCLKAKDVDVFLAVLEKTCGIKIL